MMPVDSSVVRERLAAAVASAGSQTEWVRQHPGIVKSEVCEILSGKREPSEKVVNALGFVLRKLYVPMHDEGG